MNEQELKAFTDDLSDIEKLHKEIEVLKTKYVTMFAAVRSSLDKAGIEFDLDETYLNELLDHQYAGIPYATEAQLNGDKVAADYEEEKEALAAAAKALEPTVVSNTGEVATLSNGKAFMRQRPKTWPMGFTRPCLPFGSVLSDTVLGWDNFRTIFAVGNTPSQIELLLSSPAAKETSDGIPGSKEKK